MTLASPKLEPALPQATGPLSSTVLDLLACRPPQRSFNPVAVPIERRRSIWARSPAGAVRLLRTALPRLRRRRPTLGVEPGAAWRCAANSRTRSSKRCAATSATSEPTRRAAAEMDALCVEPVDGNGPSYYLRDKGTWEQMREYFVHRSLYHLKEGDPHAWAIPRLTGQAKASFVAIEFDEFGGGRGDLGCISSCSPTSWMPPIWTLRYLGYLDAGARRVARRGQPDVVVRPAPRTSRGRDRSLRVDRDHLPAGVAAAGRRTATHGRTASRASGSTPNTSRPTPYTSRWCEPTSSVTWWRVSRNWTATSYSGSGQRIWSRTAWPHT